MNKPLNERILDVLQDGPSLGADLPTRVGEDVDPHAVRTRMARLIHAEQVWAYPTVVGSILYSARPMIEQEVLQECLRQKFPSLMEFLAQERTTAQAIERMAQEGVSAGYTRGVLRRLLDAGLVSRRFVNGIKGLPSLWVAVDASQEAAPSASDESLVDRLLALLEARQSVPRRDLHRELGTSKQRVHQMLGKLEQQGRVKVDRGVGVATVYPASAPVEPKSGLLEVLLSHIEQRPRGRQVLDHILAGQGWKKHAVSKGIARASEQGLVAATLFHPHHIVHKVGPPSDARAGRRGQARA